MRRVLSLPAILLVFPVLFCCRGALARELPLAKSEPTYEVARESGVAVPTRDGIHLGAAIHRPDAPGSFPALMVLRYYRSRQQEQRADFFAARGYAVVLVDSRGRGDSQGQWVPYVNEPQDGFDAQQWIGKQEWCNGKIGTFGGSYNGFTQLMAASLGSDYLKCMVPVRNQQTNFGHLYNDGVLQLNIIFEFGLTTSGKFQIQRILPPDDPFYRRLPLREVIDEFPSARYVNDWLDHSRYDEYWKAYGVKEKYGNIKAPAYFVTGWYDNLVHEGWRNFTGFREEAVSELARTGTKILVGPWAHGRYLNEEGRLVPPGEGVDMLDLHLRWYDFWLKGLDNGVGEEPPILIYVMGANRWRSEHEWPLARTRFRNFYLRSEGRATSVEGNGSLSSEPAPGSSLPDQYVYDPSDPVPTLGGQISTHEEIKGPRDRRPVQERRDVLVYSSEPLEDELEITGPVEVKLFAASSAVDTDFTATLTDVHPDGRAIHICEGIRGARFRDSLENPTLIEPGRIYEYNISLWETSYVFQSGHRVRLEISSSNFPRYARNQNTGDPLGTSARIVNATQSVYHDAEYPSHLVLPVIPETN